MTRETFVPIRGGGFKRYSAEGVLIATYTDNRDGGFTISYESAADLNDGGGGGSSLPSQWTTDDFGNLLIEAMPPPDPNPPFAGANGFAGLMLKVNDPDNTFDVIGIQNAGGNMVMGIDPEGYIAASGADFSGSAGIVVAVSGDDSVAFDLFVVAVNLADPPFGTKLLFRVTRAHLVLMPNLPVADPHVAGALWNNAGTLKVSAG